VGSARSIVGHAIATWRSRVASRAFHTLAEYVGGLVRTRTLAHVALSRLRRQGELRAIGQWKLVSEERAKASTRLHRAADLWCGRGVAIALFKWRFQLAYARMAQLLGKRWIYRHVARALRQWHHTVMIELAPARASIGVAALMNSALGLQRGFNALRSYADAARGAFNDYSLERIRLQMAADMWLLAELRHAWHAWHAWASQHRAGLAQAHQRLASPLASPGSPFSVEASRVVLLCGALRRWRFLHAAVTRARMQYNGILTYAVQRWRTCTLYGPFRRWRYKALTRLQKAQHKPKGLQRAAAATQAAGASPHAAAGDASTTLYAASEHSASNASLLSQLGGALTVEVPGRATPQPYSPLRRSPPYWQRGL
jgi:hypothetical protein